MSTSERTRPWWLLPSRRVPAAWWLLLMGPLLWLDYAAGIYSQFPVVYVIPVSLAAWYSGRWPALTLALTIPIAYLTFRGLAGQPLDLSFLAQTLLRASVIVFMALWVVRLSDHERALQDQVQTLQGLLPICSFCKSIRGETGEWEHLERFISRRSQTQFSHGVCPSCQGIHYPSLGKDERPSA